MARETSPLAAPLRIAALGLAAFVGASSGAKAASDPVASYPETLAEAIGQLESGMHPQARATLARLVAVDPNEFLTLLSVAALALHTGDAKRAERALWQAQEQERDNPLVALGLAQARLLNNDRLGASAYASADPNLALYVRVLAGDKSVAETLNNVTTSESDPLRLQLAGMAAFLAGDDARGVRLLNALVTRPEWSACEESKALTLPFVERRMAEGCASKTDPLNLPQPSASTPTLRGEATLTPGELPRGTALVTYQVPGSLNATTNNAPFVASWNTTRYTNGLYTLIITACNSQGEPIGETRRLVRIANAGRGTTSRVTGEARAALELRLRGVLTPQPSRKAAHYALAEAAVRQRDSAAALAHIESVVAIDPQFRSAYASLKEYNKKYVGMGNGYWRGQTAQKLIALTLDDGPNPLKHRTPAMLDTLRNLGVKATFFIVGARAAENPDLIRRMDTEGHEIANHSYTHPNLTYLSPDQVRRELCRTSVVVRDLVGKRPRFYRPPGGNFNGAIADAASALGMHGAYWTVDGFKFEYSPFRPEELTAYVLKKVKPGTILLLHNAPENTIAALPQIVAALREQGYEFVTMSELVHRSKAAATTPNKAATATKKL